MLRGFPEADAAAIVRFQLSASIVLGQGESSTAVGERATGSMTGTRCAGWLGRVVVADVLEAACHDPVLLPMLLSDFSLSFATWIDNVYSVARSPEAAAQNIQIFGKHLRNRWKLRLKPSSLHFISAAGKATLGSQFSEFSWQDPFVVLGHKVGSDGHHRSDVDEAFRCSWIRYYAGAGSKKGKILTNKARLQDIGRSVWPALNFRTTWWCPTKSLLASLDRLQRDMICAACKFPREPSDTDEIYFRRRGRLARRFQLQAGFWSERVAKKTLTWDAHLDRNRAGSWAGHLRAWHGAGWLESLRRAAGSVSVLAGKQSTRLRAGRPSQRWEQGVDTARLWLEEFNLQFA